MHASTATPGNRILWPAIGTALLVAAAGLWLSAARPGEAASDSEIQGIGATITSTIAWNPASCDFSTTILPQSFSVSAGASQTSAVPSVGCVNSNATWDVSAQMTTAPTSGATPIPASAFEIQRLDATATANEVADILGGVETPVTVAPLVANGASCTTACALNSSQLIVNDATANGVTLPIGGVSILGGVFAWQYTLNAPPTQAAGSYTGGQVTLTASNS